jgi:hypothetical protein
LLIRQLIKDTVTAQQYKIVQLLNLATNDVWIGDQYARVTAILPSFGFDVSESAAHTETAWEDPQGAQHNLIFQLSCLLVKDLHDALSSIKKNYEKLVLTYWYIFPPASEILYYSFY